MTEKIKLTRCGDCGDWQQDTRLYSEQEQNEVEFIHYMTCTEGQIMSDVVGLIILLILLWGLLK